MTTTPNYLMPLPDDDDQMNDVTQYLNNNWSKIENIPRIPSGSSLPLTDFVNYSLGDTFYHTGLKSTFILIGQNTTWGNFWRPIQSHYGLWIDVPATAIFDPVHWQVDNFQYNITNTSKFRLRGGLFNSSGIPNSSSTYFVLNVVPTEVAPTQPLALFPSVHNSANPPLATMARVAVDISGTFAFTSWNSAGAAGVNDMFFTGCEWQIGSNLGYGPIR